ncbi:hypothetical protein AB2G02_26045 (plasmid) [Escherichia coli]
MTKAKEKIDNRMAYHLQQLAQLRAKKKEEESKEKVAERKKERVKIFCLVLLSVKF